MNLRNLLPQRQGLEHAGDGLLVSVLVLEHQGLLMEGIGACKLVLHRGRRTRNLFIA